MKQTHVFIVAASSAVFFLTFLVATGIPTGLIVSDGLRISVDGTRTYESDALITWSTSREAISTIIIDGKRTAFPAATKFSSIASGLEPGTRHDFAIRACDERECVDTAGSFATQGARAAEGAAITGAMTMGEGITDILRTSVNIILYSLAAITVLVVAGRVGYEKLVLNRDPMEGLVKKAEKHLGQDEYAEAHQAYSQAREAFKQLEEEAKLKHYDKLLGIYHTLRRYATITEAHKLAEKYEQGTITRDEMRRLNELLTS